MADRVTHAVPSSPRKRGSSDLVSEQTKALDSRVRGNDEQKWQPTPTRLGDVAEVFVGYPFRSETFAIEGVPLLRGDNISQGYIDWTDAQKLPFEVASNFSAFELGEGDIVLAMDRPWVGAGLKFASVRRNDAGALLVQRTARLRGLGDAESGFLRYVVASPAFTKYIKSVTTGSLVPHISKEQIQDFRFFLPARSAQQKIAAVLSALDAKIDLNNRINAELEALAKTIYDYWFVQFDFPDAHGRPYKSSNGAMVWNDTLKRDIPAGWESGNITTVAEILGGATPSKDHPDCWNGDIPFFTPTDAAGTVFQLQTEDSITQAGLGSCSSSLFAEGTVFITARGSVGKISVAGRPMAMNQSCYALVPRVASNCPYVFLHAKTLIHHLKVKASGSTFNSIVTNDIEWTQLISPSAETISAFCKIVAPMFARIALAQKENLELTRLRDWLLPLLMNGQVRVA